MTRKDVHLRPARGPEGIIVELAERIG